MHRFLPFILILSIVVCYIEVDISVPGFPAMAHYFQVSEGMIQLSLAYNLLGFFLAGVLYGPLSESFGRRKIMVYGNLFLLIGAIGCATASNISFLLASRFIQGLGASASAVMVFAMIADVYQGEKAVKLIGLLNGILTTLMAAAPVVGGFINEAVGWRGNYMIIAGLSLISWLSIVFCLPETKSSFHTFSLKDVLKGYRAILSHPKFLYASFSPTLFCSAYMVFVASGSFLYIETFGLSTIAYALHQGSVVASFSLVSLFSGKIVEKLGRQACIRNGIVGCALAASLLVLVSLTAPHSPYLITSLMVLFGLSFAVVYAIVFAASMEIFPETRGAASAVIMGMRAFFCSLFIGLTGYIYNGGPLRVMLLLLLGTALAIATTLQWLRLDSRTAPLAQGA